MPRPAARTPSTGTPQSGQIVRYQPARTEGPTVLADLGDRRAKEILVADVDGDGRDELYVANDGASRADRYVWQEDRPERAAL